MGSFYQWANIIQREAQVTIAEVDSWQVDDLLSKIRLASRVFVTGNGRTGLQMRGFAIRLTHLGLVSYVVGESVTLAIREKDLLIIASNTGTNLTHHRYAEHAKALNADVALITANRETALSGSASSVLIIPALPSSLQPLGSLFEHSLHIVLDAIVLWLMDALPVEEKMMAARHANLE